MEVDTETEKKNKKSQGWCSFVDYFELPNRTIDFPFGKMVRSTFITNFIVFRLIVERKFSRIFTKVYQFSAITKIIFFK